MPSARLHLLPGTHDIPALGWGEKKGDLASDAGQDTLGVGREIPPRTAGKANSSFAANPLVLTKELGVFLPTLRCRRKVWEVSASPSGETSPRAFPEFAARALGLPCPVEGTPEPPQSSSRKAGPWFDVPGGFRVQGDRSTLPRGPWDGAASAGITLGRGTGEGRIPAPGMRRLVAIFWPARAPADIPFPHAAGFS